MRRNVRRIEAEVPRRCSARQQSTRGGHACTAEIRSVADGEHARQGRAAVLIRLGGQKAGTTIDEAVRNTKRTGDAGFRLEAEIERDGIDIERGAAGNGAGNAVLAFQRGDLGSPQHRHAR